VRPGQLEPRAPDSLADRWIDAWVSDRFAPVCTTDVHYEDPATREPLSGLAPLEAHARMLREAFPDLRLERTAPRVGDDHYACVPWRAAGTHKGQLGALPGSNRFVTIHGVHFIELTDGRVRRARGFFDLYEAGIQLGLLPGRGSLGETALLLLRGFGFRR
jgi:steroid delta-isomerase-like uncharacterized protein